MSQAQIVALLISQNVIAKVDLGVHCKHPIGVLRVPGTQKSFLVWLADNHPATQPAWVSWQMTVEGKELTVSFPTVGHSYANEPADLVPFKYGQEGSEPWGVLLLKMQEWFWGPPLRQACAILGVSIIVKHRGSFPEKLEGLIIETVWGGTSIRPQE